MYIRLLIVMVKPIKLYTSVLIANSDWNGQKHWGRRWRLLNGTLKTKHERERERERQPLERSDLEFLNLTLKWFIHNLSRCVVNVSGQQTRMLFKNRNASFRSLGIQKDLLCVCGGVYAMECSGRSRRTYADFRHTRERVQIPPKTEECRMGFHWSSKQRFLNNWKVTRNKNSIQEETFSIFGDPKPGSKFSSPF